MEKSLEEGLKKLELPLPKAAQSDLISYLHLLSKWNRAFNLTAIRDPEEMVVRHLLDSLSILPYLHGKRILDLGAGAGLPGIPLAVAQPERGFVLLDSNRKKCSFLTQAVTTLNLTNVEVVCQRAEVYRPKQRFDTIVARAYGTLSDMITTSQHLCCKGGILLAMKGRYPAEELSAIKEEAEVIPLTVPGLEEKRHLVCVRVENG